MENAILSESFFNGHRGSFNWNQWGFIGGSESHLSGCIRLFFPKIVGGDRDLQMLSFHSLTAGSVLGTFRGDRDTQTQPAVIIKNLPFCTHRRWGCKYISLVPSRPSHQMKLFLINIFTLSTRMHSSRMCTAHSSSRHGGWVSTPPGKIPSNSPWVWAWTRSPSTSPLGCGPALDPLNFPLGCGPGPDPPQLPPWVWAWSPPSQDQAPSRDRILDTRLWKYYLAPNFVCGW